MNRRYLAFSLRALLLAVAVLAVWLGVVVHRARQEREAVTAIEAYGAIVEWEPAGPKWLRRLFGEQSFQRVEGVNFLPIQVRADRILLDLVPRLKQLRGLKYLKVPLPLSPETQQQLKAALPGCKLRPVFPRGLKLLASLPAPRGPGLELRRPGNG